MLLFLMGMTGLDVGTNYEKNTGDDINILVGYSDSDWVKMKEDGEALPNTSCLSVKYLLRVLLMSVTISISETGWTAVVHDEHHAIFI